MSKIDDTPLCGVDDELCKNTIPLSPKTAKYLILVYSTDASNHLCGSTEKKFLLWLRNLPFNYSLLGILFVLNGIPAETKQVPVEIKESPFNMTGIPVGTRRVPHNELLKSLCLATRTGNAHDQSEIKEKYLTPDPCADLSDASLPSAWKEAHSLCGGALMNYNRLPDSEKRCRIGKEPGCKHFLPPFDKKARCAITARIPGYEERVEVELEWCLAQANNQPEQESKNTTSGASSSKSPAKKWAGRRHHIY